MSQNTSNIPSAAIARTEILKDGAAVTYGADATGGVVNFITRESFNGLEARGQYKYIDGSDGDYGISVLGGFGEGDTNFLWSAEWEHRSRLNTMERDWVYQDYFVSNAQWSTLTNLAGFTPRGALPAVPGNTTNAEFGTPLSATTFSDFTPSSCEAVGGFFISATSCAYNYIPYYNLVEEQDIYRVYAQVNSRVADNMDFHGEVSYGEVASPQVFGSPAQPVIRGPARAQGAVSQFYVPRTNPFFAEFATRSGLAAQPFFPGVAGVTAITYRAFAHGGNPYLGEGNGFGVPSRINNQSWRVSGGLKGYLGDWAGPLSDVNYDFAATYNQNNFEGDAPDILGFRLQEAMNGFGGPNCNAVDLDPNRFGTQNPAAAGKGGCQWWNPFASQFPNQPVLGLANPSYRPGTENPEDLTRWIFDDRKTESQTDSLTIDLVFSGDTGIALPGGDLAWGAGTQWRQVQFKETVRSPFYNGSQPCEWPVNTTTATTTPSGVILTPNLPLSTTDPRFTGCVGPEGQGPFVFFDTNTPDAADRQQFSYFGELAIPVLDTLNLQAAVRREEFSGGLGATVYKISGNWEVFGPLSLRGSYGTNYQTPPLGIIPGEISNVTRSYTAAGGNWRGGTILTRADLAPEEATAWNVGVIWQSQGIVQDHDFQFIVDYFDIETEGEIGELASHNQIADVIFTGAAVGGFRLANCAHPLIGRVTFNDVPQAPGGVCTQGQTTADHFSSISTEEGNAFGQTTAGIDIQTRYLMPFGPGDLTFDVTATRVLELETTERSLDGFVFPGDDRLGFSNFSAVAFAAPEWRVNAYTSYRWDIHNLRLQFNYVSGVDDERGNFTPPGSPFGASTFGVNGKDWFSQDIYYTVDLPQEMTLNVSIVNALDRKPPFARQELSYDPRIGNPLGRTIEVGLKKEF